MQKDFGSEFDIKEKVKAPFPYFGGKSGAADLLWSRFGSDCKHYVEPFFGSGAVWLNRPKSYIGSATINDLDGNIANVWRSMYHSPDAVAEAACYPVNECDKHARHLWLVNNASRLSSRLMADPEYHDPRAAGWWIWGCCTCIGSRWCAGDGSWHAEYDEDGILALTNNSSDRPGVTRQLPQLGGGCGVLRQVPSFYASRLDWLKEWFAELSERMEGVCVCCGDWPRIMTLSVMTIAGRTAVLLDPPYSLTKAVYAKDSSTVSGDVRAWCIANGNDPMLRKHYVATRLNMTSWRLMVGLWRSGIKKVGIRGLMIENEFGFHHSVLQQERRGFYFS